MEPTWLIVAAAIAGVVARALMVVLVRRWNRENRRRYPDRVSSRRFEINRNPRNEG
jgi:hypothetical protein